MASDATTRMRPFPAPGPSGSTTDGVVDGPSRCQACLPQRGRPAVVHLGADVFNLWNLDATAEEVRFDVTAANVISLGVPDRSFVEACLRAWEVEGDLSSWEVRRAASGYFTDYPDGEDWRDRWQPVWTLRGAGRFKPPTSPTTGPVYVHEAGPSDGSPVALAAGAHDVLVLAGVRLPAGELDAAMRVLLERCAEAGFANGRLDAPHRLAPGVAVDKGQRAFLAMLGAASTRVLERMDRAEHPLLQLRLAVSDVPLPEADPALTRLLGDLAGSGYLVRRHPTESDAAAPLG